MIIERCDRCGREKHIKLAYGLNTTEDSSGVLETGVFVKYSITRYINGEGEMLHLCEACTKKMSEFMDEINAEKRRMYMEEREEQEKKP